MNDAVDENLAQSLFERGAEKCTNHETRLAFCKKFIEKYEPKKASDSALWDHLSGTTNNSLYARYVNEPTFIFHASKNLDSFIGTNPADLVLIKNEVKADLVQKLMRDLAMNDTIHFEEQKDHLNDQIKIVAAIKVGKWKL